MAISHPTYYVLDRQELVWFPHYELLCLDLDQEVETSIVMSGTCCGSVTFNVSVDLYACRGIFILFLKSSGVQNRNYSIPSPEAHHHFVSNPCAQIVPYSSGVMNFDTCWMEHGLPMALYNYEGSRSSGTFDVHCPSTSARCASPRGFCDFLGPNSKL